jgi:hypothetical protein
MLNYLINLTVNYNLANFLTVKNKNNPLFLSLI